MSYHCVGKGCHRIVGLGLALCTKCQAKIDRKLAVAEELIKPMEWWQALVCFLFGLSVGLWLALWYN